MHEYTQMDCTYYLTPHASKDNLFSRYFNTCIKNCLFSQLCKRAKENLNVIYITTRCYEKENKTDSSLVNLNGTALKYSFIINTLNFIISVYR